MTPSTAVRHPVSAPLRSAIGSMAPQKISAVSRLGIGQPDVIALWYGESDLPTPSFICDAATRAMAEGRTFYVHTRGVPSLREAIRRYVAELYSIALDVDRVTITGSAMTAIMIALQAIMDAGDNVVMTSPMWPNVFHAVEVLGGSNRFVPLRPNPTGWRLDLDELFNACDERTRAIFLASPGNPTGWVMTHDEQWAVLDFARRHGLWVIADEVYHRIVLDGARAAPSFLQVADPDYPLLVINSFSKAWAMTGWRLGWITAPSRLGDVLGQLSSFNNTGATSFVQHAGVAALEGGENFVARMVGHCRTGRDVVIEQLASLDRVSLPPINAGLFAYLRLDGVEDSLAFAQALLRDYRVGAAPGAAFGPDNEAYLRICFAIDADRLREALGRLRAALR